MIIAGKIHPNQINEVAPDVEQDAASCQETVDELELARFVEAIRVGEENIAAGHTIPVGEAFAAIRARRGL